MASENDVYKQSIESGYYAEHVSEEDLDASNKLKFARDIIVSLLSFIVMIGIILFITGCASTPEPTTRVIKQVETQEVKVATMVEIPELHCDFQGVGLEPTKNVLVCLVYHIRVLDILRNGGNKPITEVDKEIKEALEKKVDLNGIKF